MRKNLPIVFSKLGNIHKVLLLILFFLISIVFPSHAAIEIYAGGKHFDSFEDYQASHRSNLLDHMKLSGPIQESRQAPFISREVRRKLDKISYNSGVYHVIVDFQQNWQNPKPRFIMDAQELQDVLQETIEGQQGPVLLISDPKKMRIMSYSSNSNVENKQKQ